MRGAEMKNRKWCVVRWCAPGHFHKRIQVFLTSERKPCSQAYACVARKRMYVLPVNVCMCCP